MDPTTALVKGLKSWNDFSSRSRRAEYWWFQVAYLVISMLAGFLDAAAGANGIVQLVLSLVFLIPTLSVAVRRLHDTNRSGWWILLGFIPIIGWILLIIWYATRGDVGDNRFGADPLAEVPQ